MMKQQNSTIIFLVPPEEVITGGIISIFSLAKESRKLKKIHNSEVLIATYPGCDSYHKNNLFENNEIILSFSEAINTNPNSSSLLLHIPEYSAKSIYYELKKHKTELSKFSKITINILNQNINMMPSVLDIALFNNICTEITQTTAHVRYCTQEIADKYFIPTHLFSVNIDENNYQKTAHASKEQVILYSNDDHVNKDRVLEIIRKELPDYKLEEINGLTFEQYKSKISKSAYVITFGEGFDSYFIESAFSGTVSFAVYNDTFFPIGSYLELPNVFGSYEQMEKDIVELIKNMSVVKYDLIVRDSSSLLRKIYSTQKYLRNIKLFYNSLYTFKPALEAAPLYIKTLCREFDALIDSKESLINTKDRKLREDLEVIRSVAVELQTHKERSDNYSQSLKTMRASLSWKLTKPLRVIRSIINNLIWRK